MKNVFFSALCCASVLALLPATALAHGGQYRGPGDVVPPAGGGGGGGKSGGPSGPTTGGPSGPSAPAPSGPSTGGPSGPSTGGPTGPGAGPAGPTTGGGTPPPMDDLTTWDYWWEFNKDPFIRLRDAVRSGGPVTGSDDFYLGGTRRSDSKDSLRPTSEDIRQEILPALKKAIDSTDQRDINSSCMVAMAKIGENHDDFKLIDIFVPRLAKGDQEIREVAALAIGIAAIAGEEEMEMLVDLGLDRGKGRTASGGSINNRTRSFALYGLGLLAHRTSNLEIKKKAFQALKETLLDENVRDRNIKVAAINGMGILNVGTSTDDEKAFLTEVVKTLEGYYMEKAGAGTQLIQAHCPTAIAKLIGRDHELSDYYKELFALDLTEKGKVKRAGNEIPESCALALGQMVQPNEDKDTKKCPDHKYSELLVDVWHDHKDVQTRNYAMISLGFIGGKLNREAMLKEFDKAGKNQERPWVAVALGVYSHLKYKEQEARSENVEVDSMIANTLADELKKQKEPSLVGALAIALGLCRGIDAADEMRARLLDNQPKEQMAGYLAIGLALMNDTRSIEDIKNVMRNSTRRATLLQQSAVALGKLGDKTVAEELQKLLAEQDVNLAKLSAIASAIGFIGDRRTIKPLKDLLFNKDLTELSRAFAAVALGGIADKEDLPWNSKIGCHTNYRAAVETLTNKQSGILDIL